MEGEARWKKVVYGGMQAGFADNHTDSSFLADMVMNANVVRRDLWTTIVDSVEVSQYLCVVAIIASVWAYSLRLHGGQQRRAAALLMWLDVLLLALGLCIWLLTVPRRSALARLTSSLRNLLHFVAALYVLTPIFHTLTTSISSDSIWACTVCLLLLHLFLHGYSRSSSVAANVSLHASIVASVLIASRLPSRALVFATMLLSLEFFLLFPPLAAAIKQTSLALHLAVSSLLMATALCLVLPLGALAFTLLAAALLFVTFVGPLCLVRIHKYKVEINGPWDEAKLCFHVHDN